VTWNLVFQICVLMLFGAFSTAMAAESVIKTKSRYKK
jgi:hypothetical protein